MDGKDLKDEMGFRGLSEQCFAQSLAKLATRWRVRLESLTYVSPLAAGLADVTMGGAVIGPISSEIGYGMVVGESSCLPLVTVGNHAQVVVSH